MNKSKVYYTDMHTTFKENLLQKIQRLAKTAGIETINFEKKYVAIKIHFGEPGNLAYIRPNYAKAIVDIIKELGGKPFLTDCNTLYVGRRKNALDHIESAYENGYSPFSTGCHIIIGDGLKGTDEAYIKVENAEYIKEAKIGQAIVDADIIISLNHFKGHEGAGFGGAIKNIGMGCGSRAGKMEMHSSSKPSIKEKYCIGCKSCLKNCAHNAIKIENNKASININNCVGCGRCIGVCPVDAVKPLVNESSEILNYKMAEYTAAVIKNKPHFHISLVIDVSPYCDCHAENDIPIVPDVGMFASFDPVALDRACADAVNKQPITPGSRIDINKNEHSDHFLKNHPETNWKAQLTHAEKLGLGTQKYELIKI